MTPEFGINSPQTVKHISQKAFFKHALEREVSAGMTNVPGSELSDIKEHTVRFDLFVPVRLPESAVCTGSTADSITFRIFYDLEMQREWKPAY